jgi:hypothetical protein
MTTHRQTTRTHRFRTCRYFCCALLLVSTSLTTPVVHAAEGAPLDSVQLAALADQQLIDREMGAFNSPLLIRMRARVSPTWPGPRGLPLVTERRTCPLIPEGVGGLGADTAPGFC